MKKVLVVASLMFGFALFSTSAYAHVGDINSSQMMGQSGDEVSVEEFEEVQDVMIKMMNGEELSEAESAEMISFMQNHHEGVWPMMGYGMMGAFGAQDWNGMMGSGVFPLIGWVVGVASLVWLLVGILFVVFLIKKISSK